MGGLNSFTLLYLFTLVKSNINSFTLLLRGDVLSTILGLVIQVIVSKFGILFYHRSVYLPRGNISP